MPHIFIDEQRPRLNRHQTQDQAKTDSMDSDQFYSPLQQFIDSQPICDEGQLQEIAGRFKAGDQAALNELIENSLRLIRSTVRIINIGLHMDEDELIDNVVERILSNPHYINNEPGLKISTQMVNYTHWYILNTLTPNTATVTLSNNGIVNRLDRIRKTIEKLPGPSDKTTYTYEEVAQIVEQMGLSEKTIPSHIGAQIYRLIGAQRWEASAENGLLRSADLPSGDPEERIDLIDFKRQVGIARHNAEPRDDIERKLRVTAEHKMVGNTHREIGQREDVTGQTIRVLENQFLKTIVSSEVFNPSGRNAGKDRWQPPESSKTYGPISFVRNYEEATAAGLTSRIEDLEDYLQNRIHREERAKATNIYDTFSQHINARIRKVVAKGIPTLAANSPRSGERIWTKLILDYHEEVVREALSSLEKAAIEPDEDMEEIILGLIWEIRRAIKSGNAILAKQVSDITLTPQALTTNPKAPYRFASLEGS